jgi:hypothetical protein
MTYAIIGSGSIGIEVAIADSGGPESPDLSEPDQARTNRALRNPPVPGALSQIAGFQVPPKVGGIQRLPAGAAHELRCLPAATLRPDAIA